MSAEVLAPPEVKRLTSTPGRPAWFVLRTPSGHTREMSLDDLRDVVAGHDRHGASPEMAAWWRSALSAASSMGAA